MGSTVIPSTVEARRMIPQLEFKKDLHHDMGRVSIRTVARIVLRAMPI